MTEKVERCQLLIIGDSTVGKTSILYSYVDREHSTKHVATTGIDFFTRDEKFGDNLIIKVKIWDTAGQERYKSLTINYFKNSQGIILVYDVSNKQTLRNLTSWIDFVKNNNNKVNKCLQNMIVIGNKIDLQREVDQHEVVEFCESYNLNHFEVSAKSDIGIKDSIRELVAKIHNINTNTTKENSSLQNNIQEPVKEAKTNELETKKTDESKKDVNKKKHEDGCKCLIF